MRLRYLFTIWVAVSLMLITVVVTSGLIYCFTLFKYYPFLTTIILFGVNLLLIFVLNKYCTLGVIRKTGVKGGLLIPPLLLFVTSLPIALIYILTDYRNTFTGNHFMALATSGSVFLYISSLFVYSARALKIISLGFEGRLKEVFRPGPVFITGTLLTGLSIILFITFKSKAGNDIAAHVLLLPLLALLNTVFSFLLSLEFRIEIRHKIAVKIQAKVSVDNEDVADVYTGQLRSNLLFHSHYLDIISGNCDYLIEDADGNYAVNLIQAAVRDFDSALVPALKIIASKERFSDTIRKEAQNALDNIEKYYSDPVTNKDMVVHSGQSERSANARALLAGKRTPEVTEVLKLMNDSNTDIRKIGLVIAGRFRMDELFDEIVQALSVAETEKEAFFVLRHFGSDINKKLMAAYLRYSGNEKMCIMITRLLGSDASGEAMSYLMAFMGKGPSGARLNIIKYLSKQGFIASPEIKKDLIEMSLEVIGNMARIIAYRLKSKQQKFFILDKALEWEQDMNMKLLHSLLSILYGRAATDLIWGYAKEEEPAKIFFAAETIRTVADEPVKGPLLALINNKTDYERVHQLAVFYPVKEISINSLAQQILSSDQSIVGVWTKACTLNKIAEGKLDAEKELLISFLFSNRQILREEGARALLRYGTDWFHEVSDRLPEEVRHKVRVIIEGRLPYVAMAFHKTRFLTLCFNKIPEEKILYLASRMKYSQNYDLGSLPGILTWVVPAENDKSGLYSLSVNVLADFIFHYSEYTDIFVDYIDTMDRETVSQIMTS